MAEDDYALSWSLCCNQFCLALGMPWWCIGVRMAWWWYWWTWRRRWCWWAWRGWAWRFWIPSSRRSSAGGRESSPGIYLINLISPQLFHFRLYPVPSKPGFLVKSTSFLRSVVAAFLIHKIGGSGCNMLMEAAVTPLLAVEASTPLSQQRVLQYSIERWYQSLFLNILLLAYVILTCFSVPRV